MSFDGHASKVFQDVSGTVEEVAERRGRRHERADAHLPGRALVETADEETQRHQIECCVKFGASGAVGLHFPDQCCHLPSKPVKSTAYRRVD